MFTPLDRTCSRQLDAVIWLIEHRPPWLVRIALRWYKLQLEGRVLR